MRPLLLALALSGCAINPTVEKVVESSPPQSCPQPVVVASPPPVWPDACVANWYAKASLPPCVESYLKQLKSQQTTIARKRRAAR